MTLTTTDLPHPRFLTKGRFSLPLSAPVPFPSHCITPPTQSHTLVSFPFHFPPSLPSPSIPSRIPPLAPSIHMSVFPPHISKRSLIHSQRHANFNFSSVSVLVLGFALCVIVILFLPLRVVSSCSRFLLFVFRHTCLPSSLFLVSSSFLSRSLASSLARTYT